MGIDALGRLIKINPDIAEEHQLAVIDCLEVRNVTKLTSSESMSNNRPSIMLLPSTSYILIACCKKMNLRRFIKIRPQPKFMLLW
jgi:hypothetical protein